MAEDRDLIQLVAHVRDCCEGICEPVLSSRSLSTTTAECDALIALCDTAIAHYHQHDQAAANRAAAVVCEHLWTSDIGRKVIHAWSEDQLATIRQHGQASWYDALTALAATEIATAIPVSSISPWATDHCTGTPLGRATIVTVEEESGRPILWLPTFARTVLASRTRMRLDGSFIDLDNLVSERPHQHSIDERMQDWLRWLADDLDIRTGSILVNSYFGHIEAWGIPSDTPRMRPLVAAIRDRRYLAYGREVGPGDGPLYDGPIIAGSHLPKILVHNPAAPLVSPSAVIQGRWNQACAANDLRAMADVLRAHIGHRSLVLSTPVDRPADTVLATWLAEAITLAIHRESKATENGEVWELTIGESAHWSTMATYGAIPHVYVATLVRDQAPPIPLVSLGILPAILAYLDVLPPHGGHPPCPAIIPDDKFLQQGWLQVVSQIAGRRLYRAKEEAMASVAQFWIPVPGGRSWNVPARPWALDLATLP